MSGVTTSGEATRSATVVAGEAGIWRIVVGPAPSIVSDLATVTWPVNVPAPIETVSPLAARSTAFWIVRHGVPPTAHVVSLPPVDTVTVPARATAGRDSTATSARVSVRGRIPHSVPRAC